MCNVSSKKTGFALAEILVALMITTMAAVLVAGLAQQIMKLKKSSQQIAGVIELRGKTAALIKDPDKWLGRMRTVVPPGGTGSFNACLPMSSDPSSSIYTCPSTTMDTTALQTAGLIVPSLSIDATEGGRYKVMATPIVDSSGQVIADVGDGTDPTTTHYLNDEGVICTSANPATTCPFISTGYFFRENIPTALDPTPFPGDVKFVAKVQMNPAYQRSGLSPMKPQLMSMDLGTGWTQTSATSGTPTSCVLPQVFQGIQSDGTPKCADPAVPCDSGKIQVGYDTGGPVCEDPSSLSCPSGQQPILDPVAKKLVCSSLNHCAVGKIFTGFHSGSGEPICEDPAEQCPNGKLQMGFNADGPVCAQVPSCVNPNPLLTYNGTSFTCTAASGGGTFSAASCSTGVMRGIAADGTAICTTPDPPNPRGCADNEYLQGFDTSGVAICKSVPKTCPAEEVLVKSPDGVAEECIPLAEYLDSKSCGAGLFLRGWADGNPVCSTPTTGPSIPSIMSVTYSPPNPYSGKCQTDWSGYCTSKCSALGYNKGEKAACSLWAQTVTCQCSEPRTTPRPDKTIEITKTGLCDNIEKDDACKSACVTQTYKSGKNTACAVTSSGYVKRSKLTCSCSDSP